MGFWNHPPAKTHGPWPAVRDPGALKRGPVGLEGLWGGRIPGPGPRFAGRTPCPRTLWPPLLVGGLAVGWVLWSGRAGAGSELATWSRAPGVLRYAVWMTGLLVAGPLLLGRAATLGHRLGGVDASWCASRPATRISVLGSSWAGAALASCVWIFLLAVAAELGHSVKRLPSGAGHDAQMMARLCPTGMVFVPSRDGISHNPAEYTEPDDLVAGADVLLGSMLALDAMDLSMNSAPQGRDVASTDAAGGTR